MMRLVVASVAQPAPDSKPTTRRVLSTRVPFNERISAFRFNGFDNAFGDIRHDDCIGGREPVGGRRPEEDAFLRWAGKLFAVYAGLDPDSPQ
ncbi:hypothetical protein [Salinisphaera sp. Q1T1-3]|uniref:hypothetical protein n=1 Tax=Salinisphaera sp. Q1T1-3 TaxID=2321229 RepID=UPI0011C40945|nr:hypothetical protein [Salinisphaera sp. Q1T1-3]